MQHIHLWVIISFLALFVVPGTVASSAVAKFFWNLGLVAWTSAARQNNDPMLLGQASRWWERAEFSEPVRQSRRLLYLGSAYERMGNDSQALDTWGGLNQAYEHLVTEGQIWLDLQSPQLALPWFRGAALVAPTVSDSWYFVAQALMNMGQGEAALANLEQALQAPNTREILPSRIYYAIGYTHQYIEQPPQTEDAINAFRTALVADTNPLDNEFAADVHFRLCDALWSQGKDPDLYSAECLRALSLNSRHLLARFLLGIAYYNKFNDVAMAEREFEIAQAIEPSPWGYIMLGYFVYEAAGQTDKAKAAYAQALANWPDFELAELNLERIEQR
jgi:tetratricopeptide (TPR) repeat protein